MVCILAKFRYLSAAIFVNGNMYKWKGCGVFALLITRKTVGVSSDFSAIFILSFGTGKMKIQICTGVWAGGTVLRFLVDVNTDIRPPIFLLVAHFVHFRVTELLGF